MLLKKLYIYLRQRSGCIQKISVEYIFLQKVSMDTHEIFTNALMLNFRMEINMVLEQIYLRCFH